MNCKTLLLPILIFSTWMSLAQGTDISGRVTDDRGEAMQGVTVLVKGTAAGTATDSVGHFTLSVPAGTKSVVFHYVGYDEREVAVTEIAKNPKFSLKMVSSEVGLNQVVVSASKRREKLLDAPASISVLSGDKITNKVVTSPVEYLKTTPGVDIMQTGLISNNVVVRGFNDIFSGSVLNVVDDRIGSVPSLRVNAYQLVPTCDLDIDRIEILRGPASALYGPNASSGVIHIMTRSPLDQEDNFQTTVSLGSGFTVQGSNTNTLDAHTNSTSEHVNYSIVNPEFRTSGKLLDGKIGYKVSGSYFQGEDFTNYDPREPYTGDSVIFGTVKNGQVFQPDTLGITKGKSPYTGTDTTFVKYDIRRFARNFQIRKWSADGRLDFKPTKDILITLNGGVAQSSNIELTGLGAAQGQGWIYWYAQFKFKWKRLFIQYFINSSDAGSTYLIPQLSASSRGAYPYQVQLLVDKSKLHVLQLQHSWSPISKLNFVYGADAQFVRPNTEGTINGLFEPVDYVNMAGIYLQGDYEPLKWLKLVAAFRADYNSIIQNVAASPRAAIVFKVADNQDIRITYNRAFDAPNTLDQFLDLAQTQLPNGMYARGIGNPYGYNYSYDPNGNIQYKTAPWGGTGSWVNYNSTAGNVSQLDSIMNFMIKNFAGALGNNVSLATSIVRDGILDSIRGTTGTVSHASLVGLNLNTFGATNNYQASLIPDPTKVSNLKKINNQYTQTVELGYKGFLFRKLSIQVDGYWTRINNYVSALTPASEAVVFNNSFF